MPTATIPGLISGVITEYKILSLPAPSIKAASSNTLGMLSKKLAINMVVNGIIAAVNAKINPCLVFIKCILPISPYREIIRLTTGNICAEVKAAMIHLFHLKWNLDKAYPDIIAIHVVNTAQEPDTIKLLR